MNEGIESYNSLLPPDEKEVCEQLALLIDSELADAESKIWHAHPVWFLNGNPIVGYSKQKGGIRLMFWSGAGFDDDTLNIRGEKFKDASVFYNQSTALNEEAIRRWLALSREIQWDYKNLVKNKGKLERLK